MDTPQFDVSSLNNATKLDDIVVKVLRVETYSLALNFLTL